MLWDFLNIFSSVRSKQRFEADDSIDKLNRSLTVIFLVIASLIISAHNISMFYFLGMGVLMIISVLIMCLILSWSINHLP